METLQLYSGTIKWIIIGRQWVILLILAILLSYL